MISQASYKTAKRKRRHGRIRSQVSGTATRPRLSVYRSNANTYAQLIDDERGVTLVAAHDVQEKKGTKIERAKNVGTQIAQDAKKANITSVIFDRGGYQYTGRVQALADAAREGGLQF